VLHAFAREIAFAQEPVEQKKMPTACARQFRGEARVRRVKLAGCWVMVWGMGGSSIHRPLCARALGGR